MAKYRLMLVDDHPLFRSTLASWLSAQQDFEIVAEASNGLEAVRRVGQARPDLVLMDINMPDSDGLEATREIKRRYPEVTICMLTASDDDDLLFDALRAGAAGYLIKLMEPEAFIREVRRFAAGEPNLSEEVAAKVVKTALGRHGEGSQAIDEAIVCTEREVDVLRLVGAGLTNREIAERLAIAENTVKNHLRNILQKLHLENRVQAAAYAIRHGMVRE